MHDERQADGGWRPGPGKLFRAGLVAVAAVTAALGQAVAQLPSAPLLQNTWATPGFVGAVNVGGGSDGAVYAGAVSWAPGSGRFELSGGVGYQSRTDLSSRAAYGVRAAVPFGGAGAFGFAAFVGVGGGFGADNNNDFEFADSLANTTQIPVGVAVGWRHTVGSRHGVSVYASPSYMFVSGNGQSGGVVRVGVGADFGITSSLGITAGVDLGQTRDRLLGGPSGVLGGVGVSYAFGPR